jgi:hypothetical protein
MLIHGPLQKQQQNSRNGYTILRSVDRKIKGDIIINTIFLRSLNSQFNGVRWTITFTCNVKNE